MLSGTVQELEHLGSDLYVHMAMDGAAEPVIARTEPGESQRLAHGDRITLAAKPGAFIAFDAKGKRIGAPYANGHHKDDPTVMVDADGRPSGSGLVATPVGNGKATQSAKDAAPTPAPGGSSS
ncbi:MAG: TOBE domain-containing protein, partial [Hyphomonas sp.]|nr:TOBE domain-containing protein [Hyphomonas sp.]